MRRSTDWYANEYFLSEQERDSPTPTCDEVSQLAVGGPMMQHRTLWWALAGGAIVCAAAMACGTAGTPVSSNMGFGNSGAGAEGNAGDAGGNAATGAGSSGGSSSGAGTTSSGGGSGVSSKTPATAAGGDAGGGNDQGDAGTVTPRGDAGTCLQAGGGDYSRKGPYTVNKSSVDLASHLSGQATPTTYSLFTPSPLDPNCPAPVVVWGNGTGVTGSSTTTPAGACTGMNSIDCLSGTYDFFNVFAASWGIVVIASDNSNVGSGAYHKAGADYMTEQNKDSSSPFYRKLSGRVGVAGHSQGGIGATAATNLIGPSCQAEVCVAGGGSPLKTTAFLCLTGTMDQAESGCKSTYSIAGPPAFLADWDGGTHTGTETLAGYTSGDKGTYAMMKLYAAWFRCFLADDEVACKLFQGQTPTNCGMCRDPGWADLESRGL
jgi:hypothetical protein